MKKEFWRSSKIAVIGGGSWGTVLSTLVAPRCSEVRLWVHTEEQARKISATRINADVFPKLSLQENIRVFADASRVFSGEVDGVIWALPSDVCRECARDLSKFFKGHEIILHATKGIESSSLKRISVILSEELPILRIGVISGPNLADEIARGEPAGTIVASEFDEVLEAGRALLTSERFKVHTSRDLVGVEWAGTLKNILAIAAGSIGALGLGMNVKAMFIAQGLSEMVNFGKAMGAHESTFLGLAGMGDLLATTGSELSRNFQVGMRLARGQRVEQITQEMQITAEGIHTTKIVWEYARQRRIRMPITEAVYQMLFENANPQDALKALQ